METCTDRRLARAPDVCHDGHAMTRTPRVIRWAPAVTSAVALLVTMASAAAAEPVEVSAVVLAARGDRVYLETAASAALVSGDRIAILDRERTLATAVITRVYEPDLAVATLRSGSLAGAIHLDSLRVRVDRDRTPPPLLRVGYPSWRRTAAGAPCRRPRLSPAIDTLGYRPVSPSEPHRLVRDTSITVAAPWPDTLVIRFFDDSADEEIALERGEIDAAVFWPGELSRHMRDNPRFRDTAQHPAVAPTAAPAESTTTAADPRHAWPTLCAPGIRPRIDALGRAALAGLIVCGAPSR